MELQRKNFAGFWIRFVALVIDTVILLIPSEIIDFLFSGSNDQYDYYSITDIFFQFSFTNLILHISLYWLYDALLQSSKWQATIGKKVMNIRVVDKQFKRITFLRASGRHFSKYVSTIILCIGYLMVGWSDKRQGLHDKIADTYVVQGSV